MFSAAKSVLTHLFRIFLRRGLRARLTPTVNNNHRQTCNQSREVQLALAELLVDKHVPQVSVSSLSGTQWNFCHSRDEIKDTGVDVKKLNFLSGVLTSLRPTSVNGLMFLLRMKTSASNIRRLRWLQVLLLVLLTGTVESDHDRRQPTPSWDLL